MNKKYRDIFKSFSKTINTHQNTDNVENKESNNDKDEKRESVDINWGNNQQQLNGEEKNIEGKDKNQENFWFFEPLRVRLLNETTIMFQGTVSEESVNAALRLLKQAYVNANLIGLNYPEFKEKLSIKFIIDSGGGSVVQGFRLCDTIKWYNNNTNIKIVGYVNGMAASMAVPILLACKEKYATPNSTIMIHALSAGLWGNMHEMKDYMKFFSDLQNKLIKFIAENSKIKEEKVKELMSRESFLTVEESLDYGLIDGIKETLI